MWKVTGIAAATNKDGRLALVATAGITGTRDAVWQLEEPNSTGWSLLEEWLGGDPKDSWEGPARPAVAANADGRFEVVAIGTDAKTGKVWHARQDPTAPGGWSAWELVGRQGAGFIEVAAAVRPTGPLVLFAIGDPSGGVTYDLWSRERAGPTNAWRPWRSHADLLRDSALNPGQIESPTLALLPESDAVVVVLFLRIAGQVSLRRLRSIIPPGSASPLLWAVDSMELQLPPESRV